MGKAILALIGVALFIGLLILLGGIMTVSAGERCVVLHFGKVDRVLSEGITFVNVLTNDVECLDVRTNKEEADAAAASKDLQNVSAKIALNYHLVPEQVGELWAKIGKEYKSRIIDPAIQEAVKAVTAQYTAEELITRRAQVKDEAKMKLTKRLIGEYIAVDELSIVNFSFSESFNRAIEQKVTAEQDALAAKNKLEQVKFEAEQRVAQSKGEAEAIRIQAQAIQQQGGEAYVRLKSIEKWNGELPKMMLPNASVPFLNIQ